MLIPERQVDVEAAPMDGDLEASRDGILPSDSVEDDVDQTNEDLPNAVNAEDVTQNIEVFALEGRRPALTLLHVLHRVDLKEQLPRDVLGRGDFQAELSDVCENDTLVR